MQEGDCWCRKVDAGAGLVAAGAGRWPLLQEGGCQCRTGSSFGKEVVASAGVVVVAAAAGKWLLVQEGSCWCHLRGY